MNEVTEGLQGLDALAKLVVCTIGLFCIPLLTRKYAQNLGLSAGQAIMSKAFYAAQFAGLPMLGKAALQQTSKNLLSQPKDWISNSGRKTLIGGEKMAKRFTHPSLPHDHPKLQSHFEEKAIKQQMMKEKGVLPWTAKDEKRLSKSNDPQEIKALSYQRQEAKQFDSAWDKMKTFQEHRSDPQPSSNTQSQLSWSAVDRKNNSFASFSNPSTQPKQQVFSTTSFQSTDRFTSKPEPQIQTPKPAERSSPQSSPNVVNNSRSTKGERSSPKTYPKPSVPDLFARYQQIKNQKRSWLRKEKQL